MPERIRRSLPKNEPRDFLPNVVCTVRNRVLACPSVSKLDPLNGTKAHSLSNPRISVRLHVEEVISIIAIETSLPLGEKPGACCRL